MHGKGGGAGSGSESMVGEKRALFAGCLNVNLWIDQNQSTKGKDVKDGGPRYDILDSPSKTE
jgi:hypothetical protein